MPCVRKPVPATAAAPALLAGVLAVEWLPQLPPALPALAASLALFLALGRLPRWRWTMFVALGAGLAVWHGSAGMSARLPEALSGRDIHVVGTVRDLPEVRSDATRFTLDVRHATIDGAAVPLAGRVAVTWYRAVVAPTPCSVEHLVLRARRPRGLLNPGGADAERTALERRIHATAYVRRTLPSRSRPTAWCVDRLRARIARGIDARVSGARDAALLRALAIGDTRGLQPADWDVARATGVSHLIAISGFHVGVAAAFGAGLAWLFHAAWPGLALRLPRRHTQAGAALALAAGYGVLAGLGLPTLRTLLMIAVVVCARLARRACPPAQGLALALFVMLLVDPLAVLSAGFWLSFVGVAFLMACLSPPARGWRGVVRDLAAGQLLMTVALLPLTLWFFGQASLVGALANLVAVPFVSFVIVPCTLLATLLLLVLPPAATAAWWVAAQLVHAQWALLEALARWPYAQWHAPAVQPLALLLAVLGALWVFLPRGMPQRWLGILLFLPLLVPVRVVPAHGAFEAWVLDVGQGLAVIVRTRGHALVYDAGARYPSGYDLGAAVVAPAVHALGIARLDGLVVSHADNDHAGGAAAVAAAFPAAWRSGSAVAGLPPPVRPCAAGQAWRWNDVEFRVLHPPAGASAGSGNDRSCVLLVTGHGGRLLLTGDIGTRVDARVAAAVGPGPAPVVLVPHHGSRGASSAAFIATLAPALAVVSSGWRNRFGHPRPETVARYAAAGVHLRNTAAEGAIRVEFPVDGRMRAPPGWRLKSRRYWRE